MELDWNIHGDDMVRKPYRSELTPEEFSRELDRYREVLGYAFDIKEMLKLFEIKAIFELAACIIDAPEFMAHELSLMLLHNDTVESAINSIRAIGERIEDIADALKGEE